jgi:hypothetical protein
MYYIFIVGGAHIFAGGSLVAELYIPSEGCGENTSSFLSRPGTYRKNIEELLSQ